MFNNLLLWQLLLQLVLIGCNAVLSCAEIALISVNTVKLEKLAAGGNHRAKQLLKLTGKPAQFLAAIQVGITLAGFLGSAFAAGNFSGRFSAVLNRALFNAGLYLSPKVINIISLILITAVLSFFTLVLGELVPKRIALRRGEKLALALSPAVTIIVHAFTPAVWLLTKSANFLLRLLRIDPDAEDKTITEEEIRLLVDAGSERGSIAAGEKEIIHNVFEFNDKTAEEVMTHRRDAALLWLKDNDEDWERTITQTRHNFYPVCGDTVDDIRGVLCARDYLGLKDRSRAAVTEKAVRPAQFVPCTVGTHVLFRKMKTQRNHFALVLDEYGCLDGIVTMNDLLECLVGDIAEEDDLPESPLIEKMGPDLWKVSGMASLDKLGKETGVTFSKAENNYDTFAGLVFTLLGRIPDDG
ncbi:MAG: hemolysin family protein, partial [Spirochaetaceae bacterium]|nr:hemolysin family protein [Spirochaetaceae bacterium]